MGMKKFLYNNFNIITKNNGAFFPVDGNRDSAFV